MTWSEARQQFPNRWLVFEVMRGHRDAGYWLVDELAVLENTDTSAHVFRRYAELQRTYPGREFGFYHTSQEVISLEEATGPRVRPRS
ncbi:hypothetical protein [Armatimonas rosea]|uniref:Uncharacterized protein n=1 Tax=Armatimonas rosea TaxID=685828 RepID=A0A7W9W6N0_ARMRO|nr:hypothetical protein [Armatimonas rosea]MBB6050220.1 hypothetical protein [Armatimonas rosea]